MILGICCTLVLGALAIWQAVMARAWKAVAEIHRGTIDKVQELWRKALADQQAEMLIVVGRLARIDAALPGIAAAARRRDAEAMRQLLFAAVKPEGGGQ